MSKPVADAGRGVMSALLKAYLRGWHEGCRDVGTDRVLEVLSAVYQPLKPITRPVVSHMRTLVSDRERGRRAGENSDTDPHSTVSDVGGEAEAVLREVTYLARLHRRAGQNDHAPEWTAGVHAAVRAALQYAQSQALRHANPAHLLAALLQDRSNRANELLADLEIDPEFVMSGLPSNVARVDGSPHGAGIFVLERNGQVTGSRSLLLRMLTAVVRADAAGWRLGSFRPIVMPVDAEAARQATRHGHPQVNVAHYLLAIRVLHDQLDELDALGYKLADRWSAHNDAGRLLSQYGVTTVALAAKVGEVTVEEPAEERVPRWRGRAPASLPFGRSVAAIAERAHRHAAELGHAYAGTDHLLMALLADENALPASLLSDLGADIEAMTRDLAARLG